MCIFGNVEVLISLLSIGLSVKTLLSLYCVFWIGAMYMNMEYYYNWPMFEVSFLFDVTVKSTTVLEVLII